MWILAQCCICVRNEHNPSLPQLPQKSLCYSELKLFISCLYQLIFGILVNVTSWSEVGIHTVYNGICDLNINGDSIATLSLLFGAWKWNVLLVF